jgi:hypothetical protein
MSTKEETIALLHKHQEANYPKMNYTRLCEMVNGSKLKTLTDEEIKSVNDYLSIFLDPRGRDVNNECLWCEDTLYLQWGIAHGEATCRCGMSVRGYHYIPLLDGRKLERIELSLQYHPDCYYEN